ncbi:MAG: hypothetical protein GY694_22090 [Gammaproteobacteria bacterium]|nr:hypothetical protein [Gammaproteobacteria bacterium]
MATIDSLKVKVWKALLAGSWHFNYTVSIAIGWRNDRKEYTTVSLLWRLERSRMTVVCPGCVKTQEQKSVNPIVPATAKAMLILTPNALYFAQ